VAVDKDKNGFIHRRWVQMMFPDKPDKHTKVSRPRVTQGDRVSSSMVGELVRKALGLKKK
jgi:hypothetical protein